MNIVVFGASGNCGRHFVRLAAARGHRVTAVVRPQTPYMAVAPVTAVRGDVLDASFVDSVVPGHDVVMSGLGMRYRHPWAKRESPDDFVSRATSHVIAAMQKAGVRRVSVISAAGVGESRAAMNWPMHVMLATSNVGYAYADLERVEQALRNSGLDWQAVRPTTLTHRRGESGVRLTDSFPVTASVAREAVAAFMLDQLERGEFVERTPTLRGL